MHEPSDGIAEEVERQLQLALAAAAIAARRAIAGATSGLLANLKAHPPRIPPTMQSLRPMVAAIAMQRHGHGWQALPNINDGHETYELVLTIAQTHGRWLVNNVSSTTR